MTACLLVLVWALAVPAASAASRGEKLERSIQRKLGRPYVWGGEGLKSYDCSGFVWRSFRDAGVFFKRTTARKMFYSLPAARGEEAGGFGTLVFFDRLRHVAIVRNRAEIYHASSSRGTACDTFGPYWQSRVVGFRFVGRVSRGK